MKLAMATSGTVASTNAVKLPAKITIADTNSLSASFTLKPVVLPTPAALRPNDSDYPALPVVALIKKHPASAGLFSRQPGNGNFGFANIEAGYGQAYECDSVVLRGNNGTGIEETRYIFFKKVVRF